jgi:uncharacterized protein YjbI with pentapeptide repeats
MKQYTIGSRETLTGEQLLERYASGERNFILSKVRDCSVLEGADLRGINLMGSCLQDGSWARCNLSYSCLMAAQLSYAPEADFSYANLSGAEIDNGHMKGSNLTRANELSVSCDCDEVF